MKISVLLATYNRKDKTIACLESLYRQHLDEGIHLNVFLTDDASSDGTAEEVKKRFPQVNVFNGTGSLFWAGGMRYTWNEALKSGADYYLLLNDDTLLDRSAIHQLLNYNQKTTNGPAICVGTTKDAFTGDISYGGQKLYHKNKVQCYTLYSQEDYLECDMANANIMMVPAAVVARIGILSEAYTHSIADFDYSLRAKKAGFKVIIVPGIIGYCTDDHGNNWKSTHTTLKERISYLKSPKGLAYREYLHFIRGHFPLHLPAAFLKLWIKTLFPVIWDKFKK